MAPLRIDVNPPAQTPPIHASPPPTHRNAPQRNVTGQGDALTAVRRAGPSGWHPEAMTHEAQDDGLLPGEDGPLPLRLYGAPITDAEALGVARRLARLLAANNRKSVGGIPDELPDVRVQAAWRLPQRLLMRARAKAEMEDVPLTAVIERALEAYVESPPGAYIQYRLPPGRG